MLKKVIILLFVGMVSVVSITASATGNEPTRNAENSLTIANNSTDKEIPTISTGSISKDEHKSSISLDVDKNEPILPTAWLLSIAMVGFLMLSNRSGV